MFRWSNNFNFGAKQGDDAGYLKELPASREGGSPPSPAAGSKMAIAADGPPPAEKDVESHNVYCIRTEQELIEKTGSNRNKKLFVYGFTSKDYEQTCRIMSKKFRKLSMDAKFKEAAAFFEMDVDDFQDLARQYKLDVYPAFLLLNPKDTNKEVGARVTGLNPSELESSIKKALNPPRPRYFLQPPRAYNAFAGNGSYGDGIAYAGYTYGGGYGGAKTYGGGGGGGGGGAKTYGGGGDWYGGEYGGGDINAYYGGGGGHGGGGWYGGEYGGGDINAYYGGGGGHGGGGGGYGGGGGRYGTTYTYGGGYPGAKTYDAGWPTKLGARYQRAYHGYYPPPPPPLPPPPPRPGYGNSAADEDEQDPRWSVIRWS